MSEEELVIRKSERERAIKICYSFREKYVQSYIDRITAEAEIYKGKTHNSVAFIDKERAEIARLCANAISGRTALNLDEPLEVIIKKEFNN